MDSLSPDLVAVLAVGVALAGLILRQGSRIDASIDRLDKRIDGTNERIGRIDGRIGRIDGRIDGTNERIDRIERGQAELRERMAKLEGLLEGLREAITGKHAA